MVKQSSLFKKNRGYCRGLFQANPAATVTQQTKGPAPFCRLLTTADGSIVADHAMAAPGIPGIEVVQELEGLSFPQPKSHSTSTRKTGKERGANNSKCHPHLLHINHPLSMVPVRCDISSQTHGFLGGAFSKLNGGWDTNIIHAGEHVATCPSSHRRWWQH